MSPSVPGPRGVDGVALWLDEMGSVGCGGWRSWAPVGQTPVFKGTGQRFQVNMRGLVIHVPIDAASLDSYSPVP
jgi:hypothetical protein